MSIYLFCSHLQRATKLADEPPQCSVLLVGHRDVQKLVGATNRPEVGVARVLANQFDTDTVAVGREAVWECLCVLHPAARTQRRALQTLQLGRRTGVPLKTARAKLPDVVGALVQLRVLVCPSVLFDQEVNPERADVIAVERRHLSPPPIETAADSVYPQHVVELQ